MKLSGIGYLIGEGFKNIWNNRMMSLASIGVLLSCLTLTGAAYLASYNVSEIVSEVGRDNVITVYLDDNIGEIDSVMNIGPKIREIDNIIDVTFVSKDEAIEQYQDDLGEWYEEMTGEGNPLPNAFHVTMEDLSRYDETVSKIKSLDGIQKISDRRGLASKLTNLNDMVTRLGYIIIVVLGIISLFIISNSIRMTMYSRRYEISIMKSVGATNLFVRIPFLVEGMVLGIISGALSILALKLVYEVIGVGIENFAAYIDLVDFSEVLYVIIPAFIFGGMFIGMIGSSISMGRYLKKEGGEILGW